MSATRRIRTRLLRTKPSILTTNGKPKSYAQHVSDPRLTKEQSTARRARPRFRGEGGGARAAPSSRQREGEDVRPIWEESSHAHTAPRDFRFRGFPSRDAVFRRSLAFADVFGAAAALVFAVIVLGRGSVSLRPTALLIAPFVVLVSKAIGLYDRDQHTLRKSTIDELPSILYLSVAYALAVWLTEQLLVRGWLGRPEVFGLAVGCFVVVTLARSVARHVALAVTPIERCIVVGNGTNATRTANKLSSATSVKATVVGRVALQQPTEESQGRGVPMLGNIDSLPNVVAEYAVDRAIIAPGPEDEDDTLHAVRLVKALGLKVSVLPRLLEVVGSSSTFDEVDGITLLGVRQYGLSTSSAFLKRSLDLVGALAGIALLSPLFLALVVLIKLDSGGPVFFSQPRIGRRGNRFEMIKFRSMVTGADRIKDDLRQRNEVSGGLFKIANDPRITRVGQFLRHASLDELPQLLNVVRGDMSLVGPRPLVPDEDALIEGWQRRRLAVKPGMTGLWQIYGSTRIPMQEMVKIDYLYGANWSVWLDVKILLKTVPYVLRGRGL